MYYWKLVWNSVIFTPMVQLIIQFLPFSPFYRILFTYSWASSKFCILEQRLALTLLPLVLKVCIHHFHDEDVERKFIYFDGNKIVEIPRKRVTLKKSAIPSIFPDCSTPLRGVVRKSDRSSRSSTRGKKYTGCVMLLYPLK